jgi:predicted naringenin-chalcone synthase
MLYQIGCQGGVASLRLAKDLAENNPGARVLVVCSEVITMGFRGPSETDIGNLVGQAIFGDAAGAVIVGAEPMAGEERPMFEVVFASQDVIPGTEKVVVANIREEGVQFSLHPDVTLHVSSNIEGLVKKTLEHVGVVKGWNDLFWLMHPGGRAILDKVESNLGLTKEKLEVSREVMRQNGNTMCSCVILAMHEMRRRSKKRRLPTAGEGLEWGLLLGLLAIIIPMDVGTTSCAVRIRVVYVLCPVPLVSL